MVYRGVVGCVPRPSPSEKGSWEGETTVLACNLRASACTLKEWSILGLMLKAGREFLLKINIGGRPIAHKYREVKMQINLKKS